MAMTAVPGRVEAEAARVDRHETPLIRVRGLWKIFGPHPERPTEHRWR